MMSVSLPAPSAIPSLPNAARPTMREALREVMTNSFPAAASAAVAAADRAFGHKCRHLFRIKIKHGQRVSGFKKTRPNGPAHRASTDKPNTFSHINVSLT